MGGDIINSVAIRILKVVGGPGTSHFHAIKSKTQRKCPPMIHLHPLRDGTRRAQKHPISSNQSTPCPEEAASTLPTNSPWQRILSARTRDSLLLLLIERVRVTATMKGGNMVSRARIVMRI